MALYRCKMCGGTLEINPDSSIAVCEYCGTKQTVPKADDEKKLNLFNRANRLRFANEFDKAAGVYELIVTEFPEEAEAYWGLVLCKYGIEYVDDPRTLIKIPTCHRTAYDSIFKDPNFELALEYADTMQTQLYREEAKEIDRLQKAILEIAAKQEPFDVFISYKETSETGTRTEDSVIANDIYDALTAKGFKVFYSRITLESKLGQEYEPIIFSALSSAKVMLAIGTKYEYYNAVWVKNEWFRYLQMMKQDKGKTLIPCYKGIDAYDMPEEFSHLQAQDMGKIGAVQELVRGIERLISVDEKVSVATGLKDIIAVTLEKARVAIEKGDYENAKLSIDAVRGFETNNAMAFVYNAMMDLKVKEISQLASLKKPLEENKNFKSAVENADDELKKQLEDYNTSTLYNYAVDQANKNIQSSISTAISVLERIPEYKDSISKIKDYQSKLETVKRANKKKGNMIKMAVLVVVTVIVGIIGFNSYKESQRLEAEAAAVVAEANRIINGISDNGENTIALGEYFTTSNGKKPSDLKWIVLEAKDNKVLLLSEKVIDAHKYSSKSDETVTWENSDIRVWLNNDFVNTAFTPAEQLLLCETTIDNNEGNSTKDKVFLLSEAEIISYLPENLDRKAAVTSKARAGGVGYSTDGTKTVGPYMLRDITYYETSNGSINAYAKTVDYRGDLGVTNKINTTANNGGVRPAMWINLEEIE